MEITVHSYFTDGYYPWAKLFVESFKKFNGEKHRLILSPRNLDDNKIKELKGMYKGVDIRNKNLNYKQLARRANIPLETLMGFKRETEQVKINVNNKIWKLLISAEDRIKEIRRVFMTMDEGEIMLNLDIDSYIRKSIDPWIKLISENDFTTIFRIDKQMRKWGYLKNPQHAIVACFQGYNVSEKTQKLLDRWIHYIDAVKAPQRPKGFGQGTLLLAYKELKDELRWGDIPKNQFSLTASNKNSILWGANKGSKTENLKKCRRDFAGK